jgi:hypothetical protein
VINRGEFDRIVTGAIEHHGGWPHWASLTCLSLTPVSLRGLLPRIKGLGRTFPLPNRIDVWPHECVTQFVDYPERGWTGRFERGHVSLVNASGEASEPLSDMRQRLRARSPLSPWTPADALYFFGYALWHYHAMPFGLVETNCLSIRRGRLSGEVVDAVTVQFAADVHTHSHVQTVYVDGRGRIVRHDYTADVLGTWAQAAHYWRDYVDVDGVPIARRRQAYLRVGSTPLPLSAVDARFSDVVVTRNRNPEGGVR